MRAVILVPVKDPARAKSRMAPVLSPVERSRLAGCMLDDLISALKPLQTPVVMVTDAEDAAVTAQKLGWRVFWEAGQINESVSVDVASHQLAMEGVEAVLRLPADIPLALSDDVSGLLETKLPGPSAVLVPALGGMGTNALLRNPPDLFPSRFGRNSFVLHTQEALRTRACVKVVENSRIALDLDDAEDLRLFIDQPGDTATRRLLEDLNLRDRLFR